MSSLFKKLMAIEVAMLILCVVFTFIPVMRAEVGKVNENVNAWHAVFGVKTSIHSSIGRFSTFSFLCLLPYLMLICVFGLNVVFDNKNNLAVDILKAILFVAAGVMFIMYLRLINYNSYYVEFGEIKPFLKPKAGNYLSAIACFVGFAASALEVVRDILVKRD